MKQLKRMGAVLALAGCLFTGLMAGTAMSQARATSSTGVITLRSIISGVLPMVAGGVAGGTTFRPEGTLYWERTNAVTSAGSVVPAFGTAYSIPAATLATDGDRLLVDVYVTLGTAATDNKNVRCNIGYTAFSTSTGTFTNGVDLISESSTSNTGAVSWYIHASITRLAATSAGYAWEAKWGSSATTQGASWSTTAGVTWASANNFLCAAYNTTGSNTETLRIEEYRLSWSPR